jgi:hypothetical protein
MNGKFLAACLEQVKTLSLGGVFGALFTLWLAYWIAICVYRVWFSPIAKIPGPKVRVYCNTDNPPTLTL